MVEYKGEYGFDFGGLKRDWFSQICESLKDSNVFFSVPNGSSYMFNINSIVLLLKSQKNFLHWQMINRITIPYELTSSVFKYFRYEKVAIDDMNEYDSDIFQLLKNGF